MLILALRKALARGAAEAAQEIERILVGLVSAGDGIGQASATEIIQMHKTALTLEERRILADSLILSLEQTAKRSDQERIVRDLVHIIRNLELIESASMASYSRLRSIWKGAASAGNLSSAAAILGALAEAGRLVEPDEWLAAYEIIGLPSLTAVFTGMARTDLARALTWLGQQSQELNMDVSPTLASALPRFARAQPDTVWSFVTDPPGEVPPPFLSLLYNRLIRYGFTPPRATGDSQSRPTVQARNETGPLSPHAERALREFEALHGRPVDVNDYAILNKSGLPFKVLQEIWTLVTAGRVPEGVIQLASYRRRA
jgi:hypothetical protein